MVVQCCEKVGEDTEDDGCAAELDEAEEEGKGFEGYAAECHVHFSDGILFLDAVVC